MAENIVINSSGNKVSKYQQLIPQLKSLIEPESDFIANASNICAALKECFGFLWVGFYFVKNEELVLGPFQGPIACTRIAKGKGVCGSAWEKKTSIIVEDVSKFPGHIACSSLSQSEIVVPALLNNQVVFVLDVDSDEINHFNQEDEKYLNDICKLLLAKY
ncbi:MAG TPA: GAF domain-containing protein [Bacteroidia bacterium]|nr:GAF domain-containing protein [Bacteroidia bacterium]HNT80307.1 GAF domain-containing protein [Bacteroidia bacterium]